MATTGTRRYVANQPETSAKAIRAVEEVYREALKTCSWTMDDLMHRVEVAKKTVDRYRLNQYHNGMIDGVADYLRRELDKRMTHGFYHNGEFYSTRGDHLRYYGRHGLAADKVSMLLQTLPSGFYWNGTYKEFYVTDPIKKGGAS